MINGNSKPSDYAQTIGRILRETLMSDLTGRVVAMDLSWDPTGFSGDNDNAFLSELQERQDDVLISTVDISDAAQVESSYLPDHASISCIYLVWTHL